MIDNLPTALVLVAFALHVLGERRATVITGRPRDRGARRRAAMFYAGLLTVVVALQSPLDSLSEQLFWAHMIQHLLLLVVAAPLIVLGRPWMSIWRPLPLGFRRAVARTVMRAPYLAPLRALLRAATSPLGAWILFDLNLVLWHMPGPYDLTLRNTYLHVLEHTTFLAFGILFWSHVTACPPARKRLSYLQRISYVAGSMIPNIGLSMYLGFAQHPLYGAYAALAHRPGGITALADQQIGAGIMWTAGDMPFLLAIVILSQRWFAQDERMTERLGELVGTPLEGDPGRAA